MKALIALSGGIDSAVAACLLREAGHEIVGGVTMTTLVPNGSATRAQVATMLMRFVATL